MARAMKDSGIEWIGEIPEGWKISRIKYVADFEPKCDFSNLSADETVTYTPMENIKNGFYIPNTAPLGTLSTSLTAYQDNDIVMAKITPCFENGNIAVMHGLSSGVGLGSSELFVFRAKEMQTQYLFYWLQNKAFVEQAKSTMTGTGGLKRVSPQFVRGCAIHCPPPDEQARISIFLDAECARIDAVIEQTRASIEEYKKLKQSVITHTVTKGIRPGRKMKDSGVEWIESIPAEWSMERGKGLFTEVDNRSEDGTEELLTVSQYTGITPRSQKNVNMFEAESLEGYKICEVGDIAANTMWLWAGAIGVSGYRGVISPSYNIYRQKNNCFDPTYLDFLLRAAPLVQHYESLSTGIRASRLRLYPQQFLSIRYPVPPMNEQKEIVSFLKEKIDGMDSLIQKKEQYLAEIESYKKSLIFEYVTGKKEVV